MINHKSGREGKGREGKEREGKERGRNPFLRAPWSITNRIFGMVREVSAIFVQQMTLI